MIELCLALGGVDPVTVEDLVLPQVLSVVRALVAGNETVRAFAESQGLVEASGKPTEWQPLTASVLRDVD